MIPTEIDGDRSFRVTVRCTCRDTFTFRLGDNGVAFDDGLSGPGSVDTRVWSALKADVKDCGCARHVARWRFEPAIPDATPVDIAERDERAGMWSRIGQHELAALGTSRGAVTLIRGCRDPLTTFAWARLGARTINDTRRFERAGISGTLDALEWARAGVDDPDQVRAWRVAGAYDGHDAACRTRAGQTPGRIDLRRSGCHALAEAWPGANPATLTCAWRTNRAPGAVIARLAIALDDGGIVEIYDGNHRGQPVLAAVARDASGSEIVRTRSPLTPATSVAQPVPTGAYR